LLKVEGVTVEYGVGRTRIRALDNASLEIPSLGYTMALVGESGSGKTTLGSSLLNLIESPGRIVSGTIEYEGRNILKMSREELRRYRGAEVGVIPQSAMNALNPIDNIITHLEEALQEHTKISKREAGEKAIALLKSVGIKENRLADYPHEFSGGMRQRVMIAMALLLSPKILIADEPTSALDVVVQRQILNLISKEVRKRGLSMLFITHEITLTRNFVEDIAVMYSGEIVEVGPTNKILREPLHPYTEMLVGSLLSLSSQPGILKSTPLQSSAEPPLLTGENLCKFAPRCKYAFDRCWKERPRLKQVDNERMVSCHKFN